MEEEDQVEDITAPSAPHVSTTAVVGLDATHVPSTVGKELLEGSHVAEASPPSPPLAFRLISRGPPPLLGKWARRRRHLHHMLRQLCWTTS